MSNRIHFVVTCLLVTAGCQPQTDSNSVSGSGRLTTESSTTASLSIEETPRCIEVAHINGKVECGRFKVSLVELLANPDRWNNRKVAVIGYAAVGFEHSAIYLHQEDLKVGISSNGLWLVLPENYPKEKLEKGGYVLVRGSFDAKGGGHLGGFNGTIQATEIQPWHD